jgi:hypothetical protein
MVFPPTSRKNNGGGFQIPDYESDEETTTTTPGASGAGTTGNSSRAETVFIGERRPSGTVDSWQPSVPVYTSKTQAEGMWLNLLPERRQEIDDLAKAIDPRRTGKGLYIEAVNAAATARQRGQNVTPATYINQLLLQYSQSPELFGDDRSNLSRRDSGAYVGPRATVTMASERDLRAAVDAMAAQVLGRAATEDEFQNALKQVRAAETGEPTITTTGPGRTVTQSGLTAEGRSSIIQEALMKGPEAEDFGKATKMMDLFYSALEARPSGA